MFNLQNAPSNLKKAAYRAGIRSGKYEIINMNAAPHDAMYRVVFGNKEVEFSQIDCRLAQDYTWSEIRSGK
ncbi:MAG: hypothetical protein WBO55_11475 [Rhizobiaceae bacterium]